MKTSQRLLTVANTALFLTLSTSLFAFAQEKHFGINPIPKEYLEIGAGMSLQDERGNIVFASTDKHCDYDKFCYLIQDILYGQPKGNYSGQGVDFLLQMCVERKIPSITA